MTIDWRAVAAAWLGLLGSLPVGAQQVADTLFRPAVGEAAYGVGAGPVLAIDGGHRNFHTAAGRYRAFADVARRDGYRVRALVEPFTEASLAEVDLLVIANALHPRNEEDWTLPAHSAFSEAEIAAVRTWVTGGGALLLIADHMPFPGAAADLATAFGFALTNGFALDSARPNEPIVFRRADGSLASNAVTDGRWGAERVDSVLTFTGQAFRGPPDAVPLLTLRSSVVSLMPDTAWRFGPDTPRIRVGGWWQGALAHHGRGRIAVFGEAAMFTAQRVGAEHQPMGMNVPGAGQNAQLLLSVLHWLSGLID